MRGFSLLPAGWCARAPAELRKSGILHKKSPHNLYNLPSTIFPKTLDTPNKICYTMYVRWGSEQRLTVVCVIPLTLLPRGNTQAGNCCTELGHIYPHLAKSRGRRRQGRQLNHRPLGTAERRKVGNKKLSKKVYNFLKTP